MPVNLLTIPGNRPTFGMVMAQTFTLRRAVVEVGRRLWSRGLVAGTDGNISVRYDSDRIMITPSGMPKGQLSPDDLLVVDMEGNVLQGKYAVSTEIAMHLYVYHQRQDIGACVHSHPPYSTAFSVAGKSLERDILPEVVLFVGDVPLTEYAPPGTEAVPRSLEPFIATNNAFLLRNHGLLTIGRTLEQAYHRHETVEHYARILHHALELGHVDHIPTADFKRLEEMRRQAEQGRGESK
jgi:L-fuculose-phosphate aldolase